MELMFRSWCSRLSESSWLWFSYYLNLFEDRSKRNQVSDEIMEENKGSVENCTCGAGVAVAVVSRVDCAVVTSCCTTADPGVTASDETVATRRKHIWSQEARLIPVQI